MSYIDDLIAHGTNFRVERKNGMASFGPAGSYDGDLESFRSVVRDLRDNAGDGYEIHLEHPVSDRGQGLADLVLVTVDGA